jgi:hypothetical protein
MRPARSTDWQLDIDDVPGRSKAVILAGRPKSLAPGACTDISQGRQNGRQGLKKPLLPEGQ